MAAILCVAKKEMNHSKTPGSLPLHGHIAALSSSCHCHSADDQGLSDDFLRCLLDDELFPDSLPTPAHILSASGSICQAFLENTTRRNWDVRRIRPRYPEPTVSIPQLFP